MRYLKEKEELAEIVDAFSRDFDILKSKKNHFNEQMTRQQYIDRLLRLLGWDISNPRNLSFNNREIVAEEYSNRSDRPDYTVRMNNSSLFYVEAKKVSVDIHTDPLPAMQVRRYGWNSGHRISVLTNFEYLAVYVTYQQPEENDTVTVNRYKLYHFSEYVNKFDEMFKLLSRESVLNGYFEKWTKEIAPENATKLSLDQVFLDQLNEWRLMVAKDLVESDNLDFKNPLTLNESIQSFLNQVIFLRFIEDNHFEDKYVLKSSIKSHPNYQSYFKLLDKKYNSGIFENPDVIMNISEETLTAIVENLYFPNVSYDFSVIDLSILSRIYENFLQQEIVIDELNKVSLKKTKSAKVKAVISTPDQVVKLMVKKVLEQKVNGLTPDQIVDLRIGDLAVGSGIFLIEAYNYIENYLVDWYSNSKENIAPTPYLVPYEVKKEIIQKVFRGFDINNQAVQLTRFSLLLRLLSYEDRERIEDISPLLPSLEKTIICGNSLANDREIDITKLSYSECMDIMPMDFNIYNSLKFDVILGNPPYMKTEEIIKSTSYIETEVYKLKFVSAQRQYDKYFLFIERVLELLTKDGLAVLLVPNKFFTVSAAERLREQIINVQGLSSIIDFRTTQIFPNVINYVAIVEFGHFNQSQFEYSTANSIDQAFKIKNGLVYDINSLGYSHWFLTQDEDLRKQYEYAMKYFPSIETVINPVNGIQTSANNIYVIPKKYVVSETEDLINFEIEKNKIKENFSIEKKLLRDFYQTPPRERGRSYMPLRAHKYVIFPYVEGKIISQEEMRKKYPNTLKYLCSHKKELLPKLFGGKRDVQYVSEWYQYGRTQFLKESNVDRILVGVMSNQPNFNIDRQHMHFASGGTAGYIALMNKDDSPYCLEYIQAWLSHSFTDMIFQTIGSSFEGDFYTHGTNMYKDIPLLPIDFTNDYQVQKYNEIVDYVKAIEEANNDILSGMSKSEVEFKEKQNGVYISKINSIFDELIRIKVESNSE